MLDWKTLCSTVMLMHHSAIRDEDISEVEGAIVPRGRELVRAPDHNSADEMDDLAEMRSIRYTRSTLPWSTVGLAVQIPGHLAHGLN